MFRLLLIESNPCLVRQLRSLVPHCDPAYQLTAVADSYSKAGDLLANFPVPDALLLNAEGSESSCFEWLDQLSVPHLPAVIYAENQTLAARAFQSNVLDFC